MSSSFCQSRSLHALRTSYGVYPVSSQKRYRRHKRGGKGAARLLPLVVVEACGGYYSLMSNWSYNGSESACPIELTAWTQAHTRIRLCTRTCIKVPFLLSSSARHTETRSRDPNAIQESGTLSGFFTVNGCLYSGSSSTSYRSHQDRIGSGLSLIWAANSDIPYEGP